MVWCSIVWCDEVRCREHGKDIGVTLIVFHTKIR